MSVFRKVSLAVKCEAYGTGLLHWAAFPHLFCQPCRQSEARDAAAMEPTPGLGISENQIQNLCNQPDPLKKIRP